MIIILLSISIVILSSSFCHVYSFTPSNIGSPFLLLVQSRSKSIYNLSSSDNNSNINTNNNSDDDDNDNDIFMSSLKNRIQNVQDQETKLPLVILDSMLPRQTLKLEIKNELLQQLIDHRIRINENPTLGMLGKAILQNGDVINLNKGVEVEILVEHENFVSFKGKRRFKLEGEVENTSQGWTEGRIKFLSSKEEEEMELRNNIGKSDPVASITSAIGTAKEITSPNMRLPNNVNLIQRWIELAKENERQTGQINRLVEELGDVPSCNEPSELAFWIGSLINPLPAMGVAMEIRPALLMSDSAEERINIAHDGLLRSIKHMDGSARMW